MTARIPVTYAGAPKLSADARAALACARLLWDSLTEPQRRALKTEWSDQGRSVRAHHPKTQDALRDAGIASVMGADWPALTPLGALVREAGIRITVEVDDVD